MERRIPLEKVERILTLINNLRSKKSCTKLELLSVLGHFNLSTRIIPAGRSFIIYSLTLTHSVSELNHHVYLSSECIKDLAMLEIFLNGWYFFLEDDITWTWHIFINRCFIKPWFWWILCWTVVSREMAGGNSQPRKRSSFYGAFRIIPHSSSYSSMGTWVVGLTYKNCIW